ncbi:hypothetical protein P3X46_030118 [Hevea brasiliensis]|uniref:Legume lectin domain-containing protein n=1 Tax=Hevea brasiliensis TaxID=3981 RepID=A0ABQ9KVS5_HEVBR|nr:uncharacterized protein LOC110656283 [Hevea brasiliensis]KAJ9148019.1 hypothetical protein P3X46_030118 [Hevea brasiliensis]
MRLSIIWLVLSLYFSPSADSLHNHTTDSLDAFLQDSAFKSLVQNRPQTGALYRAFLPANLSGMEVSIVRLRSRRLWNIGANFTNFQIPSRTRTMPHVKRLAIVYQDLGNWSSHYYSVPGYSMVTSVVGFMVFNASNARARSLEKISLNTRGRSIVIHFSDLTLPESRISGAQCVAFSENGTVHLSEMNQLSVCYSHDQGHFSIVVPVERKGQGTRKRRLFYLWIIGFVLGLGGLTLVGYFGLASKKLLKTQKIQVMERQADEDLVLETIWVGSSKMPSATVTRTQPTIESGGFP